MLDGLRHNWELSSPLFADTLALICLAVIFLMFVGVAVIVS